jgi:hypothetical protein
MNDLYTNNKLEKDVAALKKDFSTLEGDRAARFGRFEENVSQARVDISNWVDEGVSHISDELEKLTDDAKLIVVDVAAGVKKDVGQGINQYNLQAQAAADKVPGNFSRDVDRYPWVAISVALVIGYVLGSISMLLRHGKNTAS